MINVMDAIKTEGEYIAMHVVVERIGFKLNCDVINLSMTCVGYGREIWI